MNARASLSMRVEHMPEQCPSNATQQTQRNRTNATSLRPEKTPRVPDAAGAVDNPISFPCKHCENEATA